MDLALAAAVISSRNAAVYQDAQVSMLRTTMDAEKTAVNKLLEGMSMPLATEGNVGRNVNTYA